MDAVTYNRWAWDEAVARGSQWTIPVGPEVIAAAQRGEFQIVLTPTKSVPRSWFPADLRGARVLGLASSGGQQMPVLAAAGAEVTAFDNSPQQLAQDEAVARREGLTIRLEQGDMADLSRFADNSFDLIFHPVSNLFVPDVRPVWREAARVLRPGGDLLAGFCNPAMYIFDMAAADEGKLIVRHTIPYADMTSLSPEELRRYQEDMQPMEWGHTLEDQIGGQVDAGLAVIGFYEDVWPGQPLSDYMPHYIATRARKLA